MLSEAMWAVTSPIGEVLAMSAVKTGMLASLAATILAPTLRESQGQTIKASTFWTMNSSI